jgi:membrane protease subunit HflC
MNMKTIGSLLLVVLLIPFLAYVSGAVIIVPETHSVVITRFGEVKEAIITGFYEAPGTSPEGEGVVIVDTQLEFVRERYKDDSRVDIKEGAGWYLKMPFVEKAHYFDARLLDWDGERKEVATRDLRTLLIDSASRWRILDPIQYYEAIGATTQQAQDRLDGVIVSEIEDMISETRLIEAVRHEDLRLDERVKERLETVGEEDVEAANIRYGRMHMIKTIQERAGQQLRNRFGIQMVDLLITQLNYTQDVLKQVYERMTAERKRIANRYRAQGQRAKSEILGEVQRREDEILSAAEQKREEILGSAEGKRISIVAGAHQQDPEFYRFWRSLQAYEDGIDSSASFILSDDNKLLEYATGTP